MKAVFADTGYWVALIDPDDSLHQKVLFVSGALWGTVVVTTDLVLIEVLNHFSNYGRNYRRIAVAAIKQARLAASVVSLSDTSFEKALVLYAARPDKAWGLTDCASFVLMEERGITDALAFDQPFVQAGFGALLRDA